MAILWADGFDHYGTSPAGGRTAMLSGAWAEFDQGNAADPEVSTDVARTGTYSLKLPYNPLATGGTLLARRVLGANKTEFGCAFGLYLASLPTANDCHGVSIRDATNAAICWLHWQSDGAIALVVGASTIVTSAPILGAASWNHIEFKAYIDASAGAMEVRVNGVTVINETNINLGANPASAVRWGAKNDNDNADLNSYVDDIVTWDTTGSYNNDFLGPVRVETTFCDADTAVEDWTVVGAADAHDAVNEVPPDLADNNYIVSDTVAQVIELGLPTLPAEASVIKGVFVPVLAKISGAGTGNVQAALVSGASADSGPDTPLTTAYAYWPNVFEQDPATAAAWTKAGLEAALLRLTKTA